MDQKENLKYLCECLKDLNNIMRFSKKAILFYFFGFAAIFYLSYLLGIIPKSVFDENKIYFIFLIASGLVAEGVFLGLEDFVVFIEVLLVKNKIIKKAKELFPDLKNDDIGKILNYFQFLLKKDAKGQYCEERLSFLIKEKKDENSN